jgi:hypothetical protein
VFVDGDGDAAFMFKEWDNSAVQWTGSWKNADVPIKIFKSVQFPEELPVMYRRPISNLDEVKRKWKAVAKFCKVGLTEDKLLHPTAARADGYWKRFFAEEDEFWATRQHPDLQQEDAQVRHSRTQP